VVFCLEWSALESWVKSQHIITAGALKN